MSKSIPDSAVEILDLGDANESGGQRMKRLVVLVLVGCAFLAAVPTAATPKGKGREVVGLGDENDVWEPDIAAVPGSASRLAMVGVVGGEGADATVSNDGGATWIEVDGIRNSFDLNVEADREGTFWISHLDFGSPACMEVSRIAPGASAAASNVGLAGQFSCDKPMIHIDISSRSPTYGRVWVAWLQLLNQQIVLSFCDSRLEGAYVPERCDDAANWETHAVAVSTSTFNDPWSPDLATSPEGTLYLIWGTRVKPPSLQGTVCDPGAALVCEPPQTIARTMYGLPCSIPSARAPGRPVSNAPTIDVDVSGGPRDGFVYVTWADLGVGTPCQSIGGFDPPPVNEGTQDINVFVSVADGRLPAPEDATLLYEDGSKDLDGRMGAEKSDEFYPTVEVDPDRGNVWISLYSSRLDETRATNHAYLQRLTVTPQAAVRPGPLRQVSTTASGFEPGHANNYGEYMGLDVSCGWAFPAWVRWSENSDSLTFVPLKRRRC